jgi:glycosyltransferase involved in cell wall biosynthesis
VFSGSGSTADFVGTVKQDSALLSITFLLPSDWSSGGVRVTVQMGNHLFRRGHNVAIAYRTHPFFSRGKLRSSARAVKFLCCGIRATRWLQFFEGPTKPFVRLEEIDFAEKEIVIATGEDTIGDLERLERNVVKVRYCHGFVQRTPEQMRAAWGGSMSTIAVSPRLVPALERFCRSEVAGVVPNGISAGDYYVENRNRDGIGLIFSQHPIKGPEVAVALVKALHKQFPEIPLYAFGTSRRWKSLAPCAYTRFASVDQAREIYNRCKIWLVTSRDEGFCLPILEAMACGCAVISSRHTNAAELIQDGQNGFTVPYGEVSEYLNLVSKLLADERGRERLVGEGFKTVKRFTWDNSARLMEKALRSLKPSNPVQSSLRTGPGTMPQTAGVSE